jgi:hypothetical protein
MVYVSGQKGKLFELQKLMFNENMEDKRHGSKKNLPMVRQAFYSAKDHHKLLQSAMLQERLQTPHERTENGT